MGLKQPELVGSGSLRGFARKEEKEAVRIQMRSKGGEKKTKTETLFKEMTLSWFSECLDGAGLDWEAGALC